MNSISNRIRKNPLSEGQDFGNDFSMKKNKDEKFHTKNRVEIVLKNKSNRSSKFLSASWTSLKLLNILTKEYPAKAI